MSSKEFDGVSRSQRGSSKPEVDPDNSARNCDPGDSWCSPCPEAMKRAAAKKLIERYFYQLVDGCGDPNCENENCASSGKVKNLSPNQAAALAFQLFSKEGKLCELHPSKVPRTNLTDSSAVKNVSANFAAGADRSTETEPSNSSQQGDKGHQEQQPRKVVPFLTEEKVQTTIEACHEASCYSLLRRTIGEVFSSAESLARSFQRAQPETPIELMLEKAGEKDLRRLKKEEVRELEGDLDKDEDCKEKEDEKDNELCGSSSQVKAIKRTSTDDMTLDLPSLRRAYSSLFKLPKVVEGALVNALVALMNQIELELKTKAHGLKWLDDVDLVNIFIIIAEMPILGNSEFVEIALPHICKAGVVMTTACQAKLVKMWARHCKSRLKPLLDSLQQLITLKVITAYSETARDYVMQDEDTVTAPTKFMKIIYYASLIGGDMDPTNLREEEESVTDSGNDDFIFAVSDKKIRIPPPVDPLEEELQASALDCRLPLIPFEDFYNENLSDSVEMDKDFTNFKSEPGSKQFSFMNYPFILTPATKTMGLYYDNRIRMYSERRMSFFQTAIGQPANPYLKLKVRRDHIIADALVELEVIAMENPKHLKKQLVVEFEGEQGIDEGGVSKEFFQLVVEEIFNPDYGMFVHQPETETVWFNPTSFEAEAQFTLIGIVLGLAIYNNVILDVRFPMVLYKKLMGKLGTFHDLQDWNPILFNGLKSLLEYEENDMEATFGVTFKVCYTDVFGDALFHDLKEGGEAIAVNQENKKEYVDLYADFLLNKCIVKQFRAFRRGFHMVTDESPLKTLFRPEEVEMLVCGSKNFDFNELELATEYDGGYTADSPTVKHFWELVHAMSLDDKRKLLQFATGSDRVPVGGLSRLKLIIAKNGPDSDRLPTAHTCFNVLLLPDYCSKHKLQDRLEKAINYSKGFGML